GVDIDPQAEVRTLSIARRQMIEIAKALSHESELLIMDEPTSALTEKDAEHLFAIIRELRAQGKSILYITHKMDELFEIADEVSVLRDGRYIGTASPLDLTRDELIRMMVGRELSQIFPSAPARPGAVVRHGFRNRGSQGDGLLPQAQRARESGDRGARGRFRALRVRPQARRDAGLRGDEPVARRQDARFARAHREPLGWQSAEGAARPLAAHAPENPHSR